MKNYRVYLNEVSQKTFYSSFLCRTTESIAADLLVKSFYIVPETLGQYWETLVVTR